MENFVLGIQSLTTGMAQSIIGASQYSIFWGFGFGFLVSTIMHGFLITENPRNLPTMLLRSKASSFEKLHNKGDDSGSYDVSYSNFAKMVDHVKFVYGLAFLIFVVVILIAMLRV